MACFILQNSEYLLQLCSSIVKLLDNVIELIFFFSKESQLGMYWVNLTSLKPGFVFLIFKQILTSGLV